MRTLRQNQSLHLFFEHVAHALNDAGYDVQSVVSKSASLFWTKEMVKELLWRRFQEAMFFHKSTRELTTEEIDKLIDVFSKFLGENFQLEVDFPSEESMRVKSLSYKDSYL